MAGPVCNLHGTHIPATHPGTPVLRHATRPSLTARASAPTSSQELALDSLLGRVRGGPKPSTPIPKVAAPKAPPKAPTKAPTPPTKNVVSTRTPSTQGPTKAPTSSRPATASGKDKPPAKRVATPAKPQPRPQQSATIAGHSTSRQQQPELELSAKESDRLFEEVSRQVAAQDWSALDIEDDEEEEEEEEEAAGQQQPAASTSAASQPSTSSTPRSTRAAPVFKGFGAPPRDAQAITTSTPTTTSTPSASSGTSTSSSSGQGSRKGGDKGSQLSGQLRPTNVPPLRIFLYAAEASKTQEALQKAGWADQVVVSEDLKSSHAVVATKVARNGKHNKLQQGDRTARNCGVPFVCVGRLMTRDNLVLALAPVLQAHRARHGVVDERALAAAISKAGVSEEAVAQRGREEAGNKLQPGWKDKMLQELGMLPKP